MTHKKDHLKQVCQAMVSLAIAVLVVLCSVNIDLASAKELDDESMIKSILLYDDCIYRSTYAFSAPMYMQPPTNVSALRDVCEMHSEAFKCIKEKSKGSSSIIRRGVLTVLQGRQKFDKKVCTNPNSEQSKQFLEAAKCAKENNLQDLIKAELYMKNHLQLVAQRNYNDSSAELKQLCCGFWNYEQKHIAIANGECKQHKQLLLELHHTAMPSDRSFLCDDDEKLTKLCPTLEEIKVDGKKFDNPISKGSVAALGLYLVATLGEAYTPNS